MFAMKLKVGRRNRQFARSGWFVFALVLFAVGTSNVSAMVCPFCSAVARTFAEQIDSSDIVVIASLIKEPNAPDETTLPRGVFRMEKILKGGSSDTHLDGLEFSAVVVGRDHAVGEQFLLMGNGYDDINWTTPMKASPRVIKYLERLGSLPEKGPERLEFFAQHFEDEETVLAYDAYDEFARASYEDVKQLRTKLDHDKIVAWIQDPDVMKSRKRLYYTLLGVCGTDKDVMLLEDIINSGDKDRQAGLDSLIACFLTLTGDDGVALIEEQFLSNPEAEYIDVFSAIQALRFHGTEADKVSIKRIVKALRHVLDRPKMADMVIPDLARWKDWEIMERLVQMFKDANTDETNWVRTPIISYLQVCPKMEAKDYIIELREIDPAAVKRAEMLANLNWDDEEDDEDEETDDGDTNEDDDTNDDTNEDAEESGGDDKDQNGNGDDGTQAFLTAHSDAEPIKPSSSDVLDSVEPTVEIAGQRAEVVHLNPRVESYVSTNGQLFDRSDQGQANDNQQIAQSAAATPLAASANSTTSLIAILVIPGLACAMLFLLLWSVLNGWFERLIF